MYAKIKKVNGKLAIVVNDEIIPPMAFTMRSIETFSMCSEKKMKSYELLLNPEYITKIGKTGIRLFYLITDTEWTREGANEMFDKEARALLKAVPNAYIIVRIGLHPPIKWTNRHAEECYTYNDGSKPGVHIWSESLKEEYPHLYSLASDIWLRDAGVALNETCDYFDGLPYADRIVGYFFAAGGTSEWYYLLNAELPDGRYGEFSKAFKRYFSKYLEEKYKTDENLQKAWKNQKVTIKTPIIPDEKARYYAHRLDKELIFDDEEPKWLEQTAPSNGTNIGNFLDIDENMDVFDFYRALHLATADGQRYFARIVKERYHGLKLTGSFYGSYGCTNFFDGSTAGGVTRILEDPNMDFLAAPGAYSNRNPGGFTGQREMVDSFRLHNKIFIAEEDTRTHLDSPYYQDLFDCYTAEDSVNVIKRDFGRIIAEGEYGWWFDQTVGGGRYDHSDILNSFMKQQEIAEKIYNGNLRKNNEIAFIYDEESIHAISDNSTKEIIEYFRNYEIARIGAGVDQYFHNDMRYDEMPNYKLYIFFNVFVLTDEEREIIKKKLAKNNAAAIWVYASGVINPDLDKKFDKQYITDLIGMDIEQLNERWNSKFKPVKGCKILSGLNQDKYYGTKDRPLNNNILVSQREIKTYICPIFYPTDKEMEVLARYTGNNLPAVAMKKCDGYTSIYYGAKVLQADFVREIAKYAGVHIYSENDDVLYVGNGLLTVHASYSGKRIIKFPQAYRIIEAYSGTDYGITDKLEIKMRLGETMSFYYLEKEDL